MKTKFLMVVAGLAAIQMLSLQTHAQDLSRTQGLVNQALQLADAARANTHISPQAPVQQGWSNPFASAPAASTTVTSGVPGTGVAVSGSNIRVNAGGMQFDIPRTGVGTTYPAVGSSIGIPAAGTVASNAMQTAQQWKNFADAVTSFQGGNYGDATSLMGQVRPTTDVLPALNHFHALCTFAEGNYDRSAEYAYAGLAQGQPIYNWDQLRGYYKDSAAYSQQYQALQARAAGADASVSTQFLLGYHHLMLGHRKHATQVFEHILTRLPNDPVVQHTLTISKQLPPQPR